MKSFINISTALALALTLSACGGGGGKSNNTPTNTTNTTNPDNNSTTPKTNRDGGDVINGFIMPPCPDQKLNDSTLLGIDSNNNGVRDDVERWLITRYKDHHKIVTEIGFQTAKAMQIVIVDPSKAKETDILLSAAQHCNFYFESYAEYRNEPILIDHDIVTSTAFKTVQLNTEARIRAYLEYNKALSGGIYRHPDINTMRNECSFDVNKLLGK